MPERTNEEDPIVKEQLRFSPHRSPKKFLKVGIVTASDEQIEIIDQTIRTEKRCRNCLWKFKVICNSNTCFWKWHSCDFRNKNIFEHWFRLTMGLIKSYGLLSRDNSKSSLNWLYYPRLTFWWELIRLHTIPLIPAKSVEIENAHSIDFG